MKIIALVLCAAAFPTLANADTPTPQPRTQVCTGEGQSAVTVKTRYGLVTYKHLSVVIDGNDLLAHEYIPPDVPTFIKLFQLGDEDVLLSSSIPLGNGEPPSNNDFLLVLSSGKPPHVVSLPTDTACTVQQHGDVLYMAGGVDQCGNKLPLITYAHGRLTGVDAPKPTCIRKPYILQDNDCRDEFSLSKKLCSSVPRDKCAHDANALIVGAYGPFSEQGIVTSMAQETYFNTQGFNRICGAWCEGREVTYDRYKREMCMAR